ncbi:MAG: hypothetical protein OXM59_00355 [Gammaproteobacteria bacterium]|nr:hypothetical protein [Gammaproteobacteria bacterium]
MPPDDRYPRRPQMRFHPAHLILRGSLCCCLLITLSAAAEPTIASNARLGSDNLTYHGTPQRTGWYDNEGTLTPAAVRTGSFGLLWESESLGYAGTTPPRLFASPLYVSGLEVPGEAGRPRSLDVIFAASATGFAAAINATPAGPLPAGATLWKRRLLSRPCANGTRGILSTPIIDRRLGRIYIVGCDKSWAWQVHALDLASGASVHGWPIDLSAEAINRPGVNANGDSRFPSEIAILQRGALNLSANGRWLFVAFGGEPSSGWLLSIDTFQRRVSGAFSVTARTEEGVGGLWASGGPAIDSDGDLYIASGSSYINALAGMGNEALYPDSAGNWSQSILHLAVDAAGGFRLAGTYTPFNYCQAGGADIDLGSGTPVLVDLPPGVSLNSALLVHGGSKQGNAYLLDRKNMPGSLVRRQACAADPIKGTGADTSLMSPDIQPAFGTRGPLNVFGPYSDRVGMGDYAKSRTTPAYLNAADGRHLVYLTGSAKAAEESSESVPPGLARLEIVVNPDEPPFLRLDAIQSKLILKNPGSPVVTSFNRRNAVVWVLDMNALRSVSLFGEDPPSPVLYAIDAISMELLWRSAPGQLYPSGKYNEPLVTGGKVFVGTDRIQAFGLTAVTSP